MNILLATGIYPPEPGGPATYTHDFAAALRKRGHEVLVLSYGNESSNDRLRFVSRRGGALIRYLRYAWHAFRLARHVDVVYVQGAVSEGLPATIGAKLAGRPLIMRIPGDYAWEMAQQRGERALLDEFLLRRHSGMVGVYERIERWTSRRAQRVIVPSRYLANVIKAWGVPEERIEIIWNAINPLSSTDGYTEERRRFGVEKQVVILTNVRAVPWKGVAEFIAWWKMLPATHLLVVVGDGPELAAWRALAIERGLSDRVRFLGRLDRQTLARWYEASDAFVLHSGYEGWSHVLTEAALQGIPCFASEKGGNAETRDLFPLLITLLPYQNQEAWVRALAGVSFRTAGFKPSVAWTHEQMVDRVFGVLASTRAVVLRQTIMVSYERDLLNESSEAFARISHLAGDGIIKALVLCRSEKEERTMVGSLIRLSFAGRPIWRIWRAIIRGVREARRIPSGTIVTAQDPFGTGFIGYCISRLANVPLEIQEHGDFFSGFWINERPFHRVLALLGRFILRRAERVRVVSERVKQHVMKLGVDEKKIEIIPVSQDVSALLARPMLTFSSTPTLIVPCRFVSQKGLDTLLDALISLKKKGIGVRAKIVGRGPLESALRKKIEEQNLIGSIEIAPWISPDQLWNEGDLFVLSSRYEGWARTIIEAMAAGVPIVTTDVGCVGSVMRPGVDGLVVQPDHAPALADAIEKQLTQADAREKMRQAARERIKSFSLTEGPERQRHGWQELLAHVSHQEVGPRWDLWIFGFILFAILTRALSVILFHNGLLHPEKSFYAMVMNWFHGYGYSNIATPGCPSAYRSPGYLFFLTALYSIFSSQNTWAQAIVQNLVVVGILWLVYAVGNRLVGKRAALIGGLLMACYPYTFYHYTQYYHTFLSSFFLLLIVYCLLRLKDGRRWMWAVATGVSIAGLAYIQGTILPATPFFVLWLLIMWWPDWKRTLKATVVMGLVSAALIAPWTYRNWTIFHTFIPLTTDLGFGLAKANNPNIYELTKRGYPQEVMDDGEVSSTNPLYIKYHIRPEIKAELERDGVYRASFFDEEWHHIEPTEPAQTCEEPDPNFSEPIANTYWTEQAMTWFTRNWWTDGLKLQLLKIKTFWQPALFPSVKMGVDWSFSGSPLKVWLARTAVTMAASIVVFGGWFGLLFFLFRRRDRNAWLPFIILLVYTALHTMFAGYTKYRIPLDNLVAIYAGWTILAIWHRLRGQKDL